MAHKHKHSGSICIDVTDYIGEISDDDLLEELKSRKLSIDGADESTDLEIVSEAYAELLRGRAVEALAILDRLLNPKWQATKSCEDQYRAALSSSTKQTQSR